MTIINFMPAHKQAPVALWLLKKDVAAAAEKIAGAGAQAVLVPAGDEVSAALADALGESCRVIECDPSLGFVYANGSAAAKMLDGEKPLPSCCEGDGADRCLSGSELLAAEGKRWVWIDGAEEPVEVDRVVSAESLVAAAGADDAKAVGIGYPSGLLLRPDDTSKIELCSDYVRVYTAKNCMAKALLDICTLYRHESCGRCVFGYEGSHQIATILADTCRKKGKPGDLALLRDLCPVIQAQCLCEQGRVLARTVQSFLDLFEDEIMQHTTKKVCAAGECQAFLTFHILASKCQACNKCVDSDVCEEDAILGRPRFIHVIDQKACTQCGA